MARRKSATSKRSIESYRHTEHERLNNPPVGLVTPDTDPDAGPRTYAYDPHLDPQLHWAGKAEHTSFEVPTVSLHVHERIDPHTIVEAVRRRPDPAAPVQLSLFQTPEENPPIRQAIEFYRHKHGWSNRLVAGDSLLVMNSLLEKEGLAGQVQMIYIDPPYGIKYGSNFQPFVNKRDVKDGKDEDLTAEPEQIRAFRDTWELGLHSYLTYLRDRLLLARELLTESGSVFVQISDENVHHVRELMDEVFGAENFCVLICYRRLGIMIGTELKSSAHYLVWYARDKGRQKFHKVFEEQVVGIGTGDHFTQLENPRTGEYRPMTREERINPNLISQGWQPYQLVSLQTYGVGSSAKFPVEFDGQTFLPGANKAWRTTEDGIQSLIQMRRVQKAGKTLRYKQFLSDFPYTEVGSIWTNAARDPENLYVVQTPTNIVTRCLLMTTDPGDLMFDPTCVRKGTRVYSPSPALPANGEGANLPPLTGGSEGGPLTPVESLRPGDWVLGHDRQSHRVLRLIRKPYRGQMVGLRHALNPQTLWVTADHLVLCKPRPRTLGGQRDWSASPISHLERRKQLRREATPVERKLWSALRNNQLGVKFRRQHPVGPYIADFYSREAHLVVEVDGSGHFEPEQIQYDAERDAYMRHLGLDVLRFTNHDIERNLPGVSLAIQSHVQTRLQSPEGAQWVQAGALQPGDLVFCGTDLRSAEVQSVESAYAGEEVYDLEIEGAHSFITEVCAVHNCGSGTTAYVAEQWGRRWITCDTSRVALTLARQRLMTAVYDYYELAHPQEGVGSGFNYKTVPHVTLKSIANNEPPGQETLYDQPAVDRKITRVSGPFTVEAVPAPAVKSVDSVLGLVDSGQPPATDHWPLTTDHSIARSGETLRQAEWRDELLKTGLRGKAGQHIRFARLEPLPGCRWLHADGETRPSAEGADSVREDAPAYNPMRAVVSFGPQHAPLEQRQVASALEEAQTLVPKPKLVIFAAFQFDPEAAKDIDETHWPGVTLLKAQINADLLTDDLKKKRAGNESFWLIGQPDVEVVSEEWLVDSKDRKVMPYDDFKQLSGLGSLAEIPGLGRAGLSADTTTTSGGVVRAVQPDATGGGVHSLEHRRRAIAELHRRVSAIAGRGTWLSGRTGDPTGDRHQVDLPIKGRRGFHPGAMRGDQQNAERLGEITQIEALTPDHLPLTTRHYSRVSVHGFDYYNTKTGTIESGGADKIAVWLLDTDYDGRSLFPRQVFFPIAGENEGWAKLARNLKAEIDPDLIEAYRGTVSLPFEPGEHRRIAVKIVDDRGIESLKVVEVE